MVKKGLTCILVLLSFWMVARFTHHQTRGFRLSKIQHNISCIPFEHSPLPSTDILNQKYRLFGRGIQSFSFLSEDGTTILKLFNNRYQNRLFWLRFTPPIGFLKTWKEKRVTYNRGKWVQAFESYALAYNLLKEESGLLYFHPNSCNQCPSITLIDALGIEHAFNLSRHAFVLQRKADLPYAYLESCLQKKEPEQARAAIFSLISLMKKKMEMGIADRDPLVRANFGFCEGKAMQIDIGPLSLDPTLKNAVRQKQEIHTITLGLKHWLETHHVELLPYLNEALQTF